MIKVVGIYKITSAPEQNDKGSWYGWEIARERALSLADNMDKGFFEMAVTFAKSVKAGEVQVNDGASGGASDPDDQIPF